MASDSLSHETEIERVDPSERLPNPARRNAVSGANLVVALAAHLCLLFVLTRLDLTYAVPVPKSLEIPVELVTAPPEPKKPASKEKQTPKGAGDGPAQAAAKQGGPPAKAEAKAKAETKPQAKPEAKQEAKLETKPQPKPEEKPPARPKPADKVQTQPPKPAAAVKPVPPKAEPTKPEVAKAEPTKPETAKPDTAKPEPEKPEPSKSESAKSESAKPVKAAEEKPTKAAEEKPKDTEEKPRSPEENKPLASATKTAETKPPVAPAAATPSPTKPTPKLAELPTLPANLDSMAQPPPWERDGKSESPPAAVSSSKGPHVPLMTDTFNAVAVPSPTADGDIVVAYRTLVFSKLELAKKFPPEAAKRHAHGSAIVAFALDDKGKVLRVTLLQSSGDTALDVASLALVARAAPFPPPPPGAQREFAAVVEFDANK